MKRLLITLCLISLSIPAFALSLDEAKAKGLVGERTDGYLGLVQPNPEAEALVRDINRKRRDAYRDIAVQTKQEQTIVEKLAAQKAYALTPAGQFLQDASGGWQKK